jgi:hypothetical protein
MAYLRSLVRKGPTATVTKRALPVHPNAEVSGARRGYSIIGK